MRPHSPGIPYWIELSSPAPAEGAAFYQQLFHWDAAAHTEVQTVDSQPVAGIRSVPGAAQWTTFIPVANVGATVSAVVSAGGEVEHETRTAASCQDPHGAKFTVCLPDFRPGTGGGGHGTFCRAELLSPKHEVAEQFYGLVFGWGVDVRPRPDYTYYDWMLDGVDMAGLMPLVQPSWPQDLLAQWIVYFQVDDCEATARRVVELGGTVEVPRERIPPGWVLVCRDRQGTLFNVIEFAPGVHP